MYLERKWIKSDARDLSEKQIWVKKQLQIDRRLRKFNDETRQKIALIIADSYLSVSQERKIENCKIEASRQRIMEENDVKAHLVVPRNFKNRPSIIFSEHFLIQTARSLDNPITSWHAENQLREAMAHEIYHLWQLGRFKRTLMRAAEEKPPESYHLVERGARLYSVKYLEKRSNGIEGFKSKMFANLQKLNYRFWDFGRLTLRELDLGIIKLTIGND